MSFHIPFFLFSTVSFYFLSVGWFKLRRKFLEHTTSTPFLCFSPDAFLYFWETWVLGYIIFAAKAHTKNRQRLDRGS